MVIEKLQVQTKFPVHLSLEFEEKTGHFSVINQNPESLKIKKFGIDDIELVRCPKQYMTGIEFSEYINSLKVIPLNIFHARAIFQSKISLVFLSNLLKKFDLEKGFRLETLNFFGTIIAYKKLEHILCYKFGQNGDSPIFMSFETENVWSKSSDLAAIFKKNLIKK